MQNTVAITLKGGTGQQCRYVTADYGVFSVFAASVRLIKLTPATVRPMAGISGKVSCLVGWCHDETACILSVKAKRYITPCINFSQLLKLQAYDAQT